jgi:hypothetical protein
MQNPVCKSLTYGKPCLQVMVDDAELLTDWQRRNAEFKQRKKIAGAMGAQAS